MTALALGGQFQAEVALFGDTHDGNRIGHAHHGSRCDHAPLVQHHFQTHTALGQQRRNGGRPLATTHFLVVTKGQV